MNEREKRYCSVKVGDHGAGFHFTRKTFESDTLKIQNRLQRAIARAVRSYKGPLRLKSETEEIVRKRILRVLWHAHALGWIE